MDIFEIGEEVVVVKGNSNNHLDWLDIHEENVGRKLPILMVDYQDNSVCLNQDCGGVWYSMEWIEKVNINKKQEDSVERIEPNIFEPNRLEILRLMNEMHIGEETLFDLDMWEVSVVTLNIFNEYETYQALFRDRGDAERWLSYVTNIRPFYAYCCDRYCWNREDEMLNKSYGGVGL